jgi:hypothetical protein
VTTVGEVVDALVGNGFGRHVYELARCGHCAEAPDPHPYLLEAELLPAFVDCPECGVPRRVLGYVPIDGQTA